MEIFLIILLVIAASCVGTMTGFGTSTIMVPALLILYPMPMEETLLFVGVIHWFGNVWKIILFKRGFDWKLILSFGVPGMAAAWLGAKLVFEMPKESLSRILGGFLVAYVVFLFAKRSFRVRPNVVTGACGGALSGFFAGIFGIGGAVRGLFLTAFDLPKEVYIATAGVIALFVDTTRLGTYVSEGTWFTELPVWGFLLFIPASFAGARIARRVVDRIPQEHFRKVVAVFLLLLGLKLLLAP